MKKIAFIFSISFLLCLGNISAQNVVLDDKKVAAIESLVENKLLKFDYELEKAWVSPTVWTQYNLDGKQSFTILCAMYIKHRKRDRSDKHPVLDLYDYNNGKRIASFGPLAGFRTFN
tara:strand:+ start:610 stop:960 length:351 start_codon:yes stop_codon:yes gene_type:complete